MIHWSQGVSSVLSRGCRLSVTLSFVVRPGGSSACHFESTPAIVSLSMVPVNSYTSFVRTHWLVPFTVVIPNESFAVKTTLPAASSI